MIQNLNLKPTDPLYPHPRKLCAIWGPEVMDLKLEYIGDSSGYKGAQLDNEVSPRIVECVNALDGIERPADVCILSRDNARFISTLLGKLAKLSGDAAASSAVREAQRRLSR